MILESRLLKDYNVRAINRQVLNELNEIDAMYYYSMSHTATDDTGNLISVSCGVEKLILMIEDKKARLESFKRVSARRLKSLNTVVSKYSTNEQKIIKEYMQHESIQPDNEVVQKLRKDLYQREQIKRARRNLAREFQNKEIMKDHIKELSKKLEVVAL